MQLWKPKYKTFPRIREGSLEKRTYKLTNGTDVGLVKLEFGILQETSERQIHFISFKRIPLDLFRKNILKTRTHIRYTCAISILH